MVEITASVETDGRTIPRGEENIFWGRRERSGVYLPKSNLLVIEQNIRYETARDGTCGSTIIILFLLWVNPTLLKLPNAATSDCASAEFISKLKWDAAVDIKLPLLKVSLAERS